MSGTTSLEGEWNGAHTVSGCGTLPTGVRMQPQHQEWGKGEGKTGLRCRRLPGPPVPRQRRSSLSLAQGRGIRKKSGMRSKESYFFFRSWEQRGQNHFPRGLVVSPTQAKWNHSMEQSGLSQPIISP